MIEVSFKLRIGRRRKPSTADPAPYVADGPSATTELADSLERSPELHADAFRRQEQYDGEETEDRPRIGFTSDR